MSLQGWLKAFKLKALSHPCKWHWPDLLTCRATGKNRQLSGSSSPGARISWIIIKRTNKGGKWFYWPNLISCLQDLAAYKSYKDKAVMMAARSLIQLYRTTHPELLHRKDRGRPTEATAELLETGRKYGETSVKVRCLRLLNFFACILISPGCLKIW